MMIIILTHLLLPTITIQTFRLEDKNDYEYEISFKFFSRIVKK